MTSLDSLDRMTTDSTKFVSVIMAARNAADTIGEAIASVLAQTHSSFELLICDDASTDATASVLDAVSDPRIKIVRNLSQLGPGASRDLAMSGSTAPWIAFIDADDAWEPVRLQAMLQAAESHGVDLVFDNIMTCRTGTDGRLSPFRKIRRPGVFGAEGTSVAISPTQLVGSERLICQPLFTRRLLTNTGARHSRHPYGEDTFFLLKLLSGRPALAYLPGAMYLYRLSNDSASNNPDRFRLLLEILYDSLPEFRLDSAMHGELERKIARLERQGRELELKRALKQLDFPKALRIFVRSPRTLLDVAGHAFRVQAWRVMAAIGRH